MLIRQFAYGLLLIQHHSTLPVYLLVERLQTRIDGMGVWGNISGIAFVTGLPISLVEDIIKEGSVYCHGL